MTQETAVKNPLATEKISKLLLKFSVPTIFTLLVNALYNIVDQIFIGHGIGFLGITATNVAFPFSTLACAAALFIGDGCAAQISLSLGKNEPEEANRCFGAAFFMLLLSGLVLFLLSTLFLEEILVLFGATPTVMPYALEYTRPLLIGLPFVIINVSFSSIIRSDGNPKYTMLCMITGAVINVILDPIFIFLLDLGVFGAAAATIIGQIVSALLCLFYIPKLKMVHLYKKYFRLNLTYCWKVLSLGISSFMTQMATMLVQITMNNMMRKYGALSVYGSEIPLACYGIMVKLYQIAYAMFVGFSSGSQPVYGYNYGAKQYERVYDTYKTALKAVLFISSVWFLIFQIFPVSLMKLFLQEESELYLSFTKQCFRIYMLLFFGHGFPIITVSFFQAIGKPQKALFLSMSRQALFIIPLAVLLPVRFGIRGALMASPAADFIAILLSSFMILQEFSHWKKEGRILCPKQ